MTADGVRFEFGSRRHACPSSPAFREATVRIAEQLARRYGSHPALAMWHVSNEYGCHLTACYCATSAEHFRRWLRGRYGELAELNRAWGTAFWGQRYGDWAEIEPPRRTPASVNPTQALDWARFCSDALLECYELERAVLVEHGPGIPVTTNFMSLFKPVDSWAWAAREDVVTLDSYPDPAEPEAHVAAALNYDLMRSLAGGRPWLLLEHAASAVNWREVNVPKRPGLMRLWAHQAIARGSDGAMFFQWRASRAGSEKFHSALVPHGGRDSRGWQETLRLGEELGALAEVAGTSSPAEVAFLFDWESWWALEGDDHPSALLDLRALVLGFYRPFHRGNVAVDFAHPAADLSGYRLVVAPNLYLATEAALESLAGFVAGGGILLSGFFSGVVDENDHVRAWAGHRFHGLIGARVDEYWPVAPGAEVAVSFGSGAGVHAHTWSEWLELESAEPVANYASGVLEGRPAVVRNRVGDGIAYYVSAGLDDDGLELVARTAWEDAGVAPVAEAPPGVEVCRRGAYLFVLNHTDEPVDVGLPFPRAAELLRGEEIETPVRLSALGVAVLREP